MPMNFVLSTTYKAKGIKFLKSRGAKLGRNITKRHVTAMSRHEFDTRDQEYLFIKQGSESEFFSSKSLPVIYIVRGRKLYHTRCLQIAPKYKTR